MFYCRAVSQNKRKEPGFASTTMHILKGINIYEVHASRFWGKSSKRQVSLLRCCFFTDRYSFRVSVETSKSECKGHQLNTSLIFHFFG